MGPLAKPETFPFPRKFAGMPKAPSMRELANPQGLTEGVYFTFVLVFPVYRIFAKGARVENPHETKE